MEPLSLGVGAPTRRIHRWRGTRLRVSAGFPPDFPHPDAVWRPGLSRTRSQWSAVTAAVKPVDGRSFSAEASTPDTRPPGWPASPRASVVTPGSEAWRLARAEHLPVLLGRRQPARSVCRCRRVRDVGHRQRTGEFCQGRSGWGKRRGLRLGEVVEQLGTVGVATLTCKRVLDTERLLDREQRRPDALHRHAGLADGREHHALGQRDERNVGAAPGDARQNGITGHGWPVIRTPDIAGVIGSRAASSD